MSSRPDAVTLARCWGDAVGERHDATFLVFEAPDGSVTSWSTVEVEAVVTAHPSVLEASVVGAPDPIRDEVPVAFVVPVTPASPPTVAELHSWCADRLAKAKVPREFTLLDELPRTSVGKIRKFMLKESVMRECSK